jgi:hypothetical protein
MTGDSGNVQGGIIPEAVSESIAEMLLAVDESLEAVWAVHQSLVRDEALYLACWAQLDASFRRHWTGSLEDYRVDHAIEDGSRLKFFGSD